jgi:hypothetical protein
LVDYSGNENQKLIVSKLPINLTLASIKTIF